MSKPAFELRLVEDNLHAGAALELPDDAINRVVYVAHGSITAGRATFSDDQAWHGRGAALIEAGSTDDPVVGQEVARLRTLFAAERQVW